MCAYLIWEKEGRPHGRYAAHWLQAEKQLKLDCTQDAASMLQRLEPAALAVPPVLEPPRAKRRSNSKRLEGAAA